MTATASASSEPADLSGLLEPIRAQHDLPALTAGIVTPDGLVAAGVTGVRQRGRPELATLQDKFHLGSCTKAMTATLCAMLVQEGKLRWDQTLAETFPREARKFNLAFAAVTLEQLLNHRAGFPTDVDPLVWSALWATKDELRGRRTLLEDAAAREPEHAPGSATQYSNTNYVLAGHMAETVARRRWEQLIRDRLFVPLGMASAGFGAPGHPRKTDQPRGHNAQGKPVPPGVAADNPSSIGPAGTVHCTLEDWAKFVALHLRGANGDTPLLKQDGFRKLHTPVGDAPAPHAMGWLVVERGWAGGAALNHGGSNTMWYCVAWLAPEKDFAILVMTNQADAAAKTAANDAVGALIKHHLAQ